MINVISIGSHEKPSEIPQNENSRIIKESLGERMKENLMRNVESLFEPRTKKNKVN